MDHVCCRNVFASRTVACVWTKESRRRLPYMASAVFPLKIWKCKFLREMRTNRTFKLLELGTFPIQIGVFIFWLLDELLEMPECDLKKAKKAGITIYTIIS